MEKRIRLYGQLAVQVHLLQSEWRISQSTRKEHGC